VGEGPGLARHVTHIGHPDAALLEHLPRHALLQILPASTKPASTVYMGSSA
jgi:hypothetical protein